MKGPSILRRLGIVMGLVGLLMATQGCTYLQHRGDDFAEMMDLGITITREPCIGLYANGLSLVCAGYSKIDGTFAGWGGGQFGVTPHYNKCYGFGLWGYEEIGWGDFNKNNPDTLHCQYQGIVGLVTPPHVGGPSYVPACVHFFPHLGYVGFVWNARYMEIVDFFVGWTTLDIIGDDGKERGAWRR